MKKKLNKKQRLSVVLVGVLLLGVVGYIGYGKVVDYVIAKMLEQQIEEMMRASQQISELPSDEANLQDTIDHDKVIEPIEEIMSSNKVSEESETLEENQINTEIEHTVPLDKVVVNEQEDIPIEDLAKEEIVQIEEAVKEEDVTKESVVAEEDFQELVDQKVEEVTSQISTKDKYDMSNLIFSNLSMDQIEYLAKIMLDGVTDQDIAIAKSIALENFSGETLEAVQEYYRKYYYLMK